VVIRTFFSGIYEAPASGSSKSAPTESNSSIANPSLDTDAYIGNNLNL